jgi:hypothetical protein
MTLNVKRAIEIFMGTTDSALHEPPDLDEFVFKDAAQLQRFKECLFCRLLSNHSMVTKIPNEATVFDDIINIWYTYRITWWSIRYESHSFEEVRAFARMDLIKMYNIFREQDAIQQALNKASQETGFDLGA